MVSCIVSLEDNSVVPYSTSKGMHLCWRASETKKSSSFLLLQSELGQFKVVKQTHFGYYLIMKNTETINGRVNW